MHAFTQALAVVFPGQAALRKGLGRALFARHRPALRQAEEALGYSLAEAVECEWLEHTPYVQPALFAVNALAYREWIDAHGAAPAFAAGHGLGECNALHAAGAFDFQTGLSLAAERGRLMAAAGGGRMAAVIGWSAQRLRDELAAIGADGHPAEAIDIAGYDAPEQQTIAGAAPAMARAAARLRRRGARVMPLRASGAFHSRHMREAAAQFARALAAVEFAPLAFAVVSNLEAQPYARGREAQVLAAQIAAAVRWTDSLGYLLDAGVQRFEEPGPAPVMAESIEQFRAARPASRARGEARFDSAVPPLSFAAAARPRRRPSLVAVPALLAPAIGAASAVSPGMRASAGDGGRRASARREAGGAAAMQADLAGGRGAARMAWTGGSTGTFGFRDAGGVAMAQLEQDLVAMRVALPSGQAWGGAAPAGVVRIQGEDASPADAAAAFAALDARARRDVEHRQLLALALADALRSRAGRPLRVLELGDGHGEGVERALPALDAAGEPVEFVYADASPFRAALVAARFGAGRPYLRSVVFDPRGIVADAAALRGRFDLILADTALDGGADPRPVLATAAGWLAADGELLFAVRDDAPPRDWPVLLAAAGLAPAPACDVPACAQAGVRLHRVERVIRAGAARL
ncbi:malonyl CoA-acyl carrier protein transacylase [Lysobacter sp. yr284]|uniref:acyltransferase domain-containing protein n=1 Tax=Lysobacter sp. yr284 TaxID=1761791 RepID=UPI00089A3AE8|nr:acyltransferase domain-containing protein [Lysobacter sp. yr284]SDY96130.1 malonyl CoA-acyl carrier protein transacylase [Lysobacter sp. yr284]